MKDMNHFGLSDIDALLGTHLTGTVQTVNSTQQALNTLNPKIQFVSDHFWELVVAWFLLTTLACILAIKITK